MKKFIVIACFGLMFSLTILNAMEQPEKEQIAEIPQITNWDKLPKELKAHILSFVPVPKNYKDWIAAMQVSKEFHELLSNQFFLDDFAKNLALHHQEDAFKLLNAAIENKNTPLISALINATDYLKIKAEDIFTFWPVRSDVQETLLKAGISINALGRGGYTGLMWALFKNDLDKAKWFINNGADIDQKDKEGDTITYWINEHFENGPIIDAHEKQEWLNLIHSKG